MVMCLALLGILQSGNGQEARPWLTAWAMVGPLVGVMLGSYLSLRNQRKQWVLDNKKQEYRELLTTLSEACGEIITFRSMMVQSPGAKLVCDEAIKKVATVMIDRIFIAREVQKIKLVERWREALIDVEQNNDLQAFAKRIHAILQDIISMATGIVD